MHNNIFIYRGIPADQQVYSQMFGSNYSVLEASAENADSVETSALKNESVR